MSAISLIFPFLFSWLNKLRGDGDKVLKIQNFTISNTYLCIFAVGLSMFLATFNIFFAIGSMVLYGVGETFGWGKWIQSVQGWGNWTQEQYNLTEIAKREEGRNNGIHMLANKIFAEDKDFMKYSIMALILRSALWWVPMFFLALILGVTSFIGFLMASVIVCLAFPIAFYAAFKIKGAEGYWELGEYIYGFGQGFALLALLY